MKIFLADALPHELIRTLEGEGLVVESQPSITPEGLVGALSDVDILLVRSKKVRAEAIAAAPRLSLVVRAGAGVDNIDMQAASSRGIYVSNCPGKNALAVAELTMGLLLALDRQIPAQVSALREGIWDKKRFSVADGLFGKRMGIVGRGPIARAVIARASAFGLRCKVYSPGLSDAEAEELGVVRVDSLLSLAAQVDVLSLHCALNDQTKRFVSREVLQKLPERAIFLNTARAGLVDQAALLEAIDTRKLRVGLDGFHDEPVAAQGSFSDFLGKHPSVLGTHHIGASTEQAQQAIAEEAVRVVLCFLREGQVPNCVNLARKTPARWQLVVRHYDRVGVLARILGAIERCHINVQEVQNQIFEGAIAACARIQLDAEPPASLVERLRSGDKDIIQVELLPLH